MLRPRPPPRPFRRPRPRGPLRALRRSRRPQMPTKRGWTCRRSPSRSTKRSPRATRPVSRQTPRQRRRQRLANGQGRRELPGIRRPARPSPAPQRQRPVQRQARPT
ncbi:MAG: hypothetical protein EXR79_12290 [Myxococcales bacterium]|nr:hypothetical protein [Myxococcales bacterium]